MAKTRILAAFVLLGFLCCVACANGADYVVVVRQSTLDDPSWSKVVTALKDKHHASVVAFEQSCDESLPQLAKVHPRFTCFVAKPSEATREFVAKVHKLTRKYDSDPYTDTLWGILTGYDADNALKIAQHNTPLVVKKVASGTEIATEMIEEGVWYCELKKNRRVRKYPGGQAESV
ncbi:MAG: hypothetical protein AAF497_14430, partial [Planctomycetota bacterium]